MNQSAWIALITVGVLIIVGIVVYIVLERQTAAVAVLVPVFPVNRNHNLDPRAHNLIPTAHNLNPTAHNLNPNAHNLNPNAHNLNPNAHNLIAEGFAPAL